MAKKKTNGVTIETIIHDEATRKNIPTAEYQSVMKKEQQKPVMVAFERMSSGLEAEKELRNPDLDPQLVWKGKDKKDWDQLVVQAPPLYIQEKVHPKALIDDLLRETKERKHESGESELNLFSDFNGIPKGADKTEFYKHDQNWSNRMILGDSLAVMASLVEREGLRGKVQCIYFDPPYGIKFNSNFQWSTTSRDVKDGKADHITREPEQVKAFRDTWRDGIHSYLTYLRDRLTVARDLLTESGSLFVQIGDENVHRVRVLMDEVFGDKNCISHITIAKTTGMSGDSLSSVTDHVLWYGKNHEHTKYNQLLEMKEPGGEGASAYKRVYFEDGTERAAFPEEIKDISIIPIGGALFATGDITSNRPNGPNDLTAFEYRGKIFSPGKRTFGSNLIGMRRVAKADRVVSTSTGNLAYRRLFNDFPAFPITNIWTDTVGQNQFGGSKTYVVQTALSVIVHCILMCSDPGDLVLDPTCGSGSTAYVSEQWGRRWITIDTSRVALALARARIMGARYPYYLLADSREGQVKEAEVTQTVPSSHSVYGDMRHGFVYERVPHVTLKSIANNAEIDVIWEKWQAVLEPLRSDLNESVHKKWEEWEIPREAEEKWSNQTKKLHADWWRARIARQREINGSIAAKADFEYLYDKPYEDKKKVRVAGPFTVESLSPHRVLGVDENDELIDKTNEPTTEYAVCQSFPQMIMENLKTSGVQQAHREDKIQFTSLVSWPGELICGEGRYMEKSEGKEIEKRAAIFIGPEFGTVTRPDLVSAAKEAGEANFDVLICCAFNYEAHATEFNKLGRIPVLKARMNADLHMAEDLKNTGKGNLFVIFGEPDISILPQEDGRYRIKVNGVDVFHPNTGEVRSDGPEGIACWFIDTDYDEESFFVRHAYFLGAGDPYGSLRTTLKAEINAEAWQTLNSDISRPFERPKSGRIAVKVINHLGDEVMKVFKIDD